MSGLLLAVVKGPDAGRTFPIRVGRYRVVGRALGMDGGTALMSTGERRRLDVEDHRVLGEHLAKRHASGRVGARAEAAFDREPDVDLQDDAVSQTHCMVFVDEAGASLVDVGSTNGTYVNGEKVQGDVELVVGDLLRVGETRFEVRGG